MKVITAHRVTTPPYRNKYLFATIFLVALVLVGFLVYRTQQNQKAIVFTNISQSVLEEQYGLHVNLIAVTAAGGLVDLRFKIVDGEKAKSLLQNPDNFPSLWIQEGKVSLAVPEESRSQIEFENDGNLFLMFPNVAGLVKPGTPVSIRFGNTQLEPIPAR